MHEVYYQLHGYQGCPVNVVCTTYPSLDHQQLRLQSSCLPVAIEQMHKINIIIIMTMSHGQVYSYTCMYNIDVCSLVPIQNY